MKDNVNRLALDSTFNTRELGGYPTLDGRVTRYGCYLRSDRLDGLTQEDIKQLKAYGITTVIDLRSQKETEEMPDLAVMASDLVYIHYPLMDELMYEKSVACGIEDMADYAGSYVEMVMNTERIKGIMHILANAQNGVLFHCTAGQDRTGILSMILLMTAHVGLADIKNDYLITSTYIGKDTRIMAMLPEGMDFKNFKTNPVCIQAAYDAILEKYHTIEAYLENCGLSNQQICSLRENFTECLAPAKVLRRLPLDGAYNFRELGGYPAAGGYTRYHSFLRSDDISRLTSKDLDFLSDYGIRWVIDLRGEEEKKQAPDRVLGDSRFHYISIPFIGEEFQNVVSDATKVNRDSLMFELRDFYTGLLKNKKIIFAVLHQIAQIGQPGILFHCSAGKDRTGVLAMLLLLICGVSESDILANYQQTYMYLMENPVFQDSARKYSQRLLYSNVEEMQIPYQYLMTEYKTIENYCEAIGLPVGDIQKIREMMTL